MCDRLTDLLGKADDGGLCETELLELRDHLESCAPLAVRLVRERCPREHAPSRLRLRILRIWRNEAQIGVSFD